jgi:hypothetical protein
MTTPAFTADCGHQIPALPDGHCGGTGYATANGKKICYQCASDNERAWMVEHGASVLYLSNGKITDWPGVLNFPAFNVRRSYGVGFYGRRYPIVTGRFVGPDGRLWTFRNAGDSQIARCRRLKVQL